MLPNSVFLKVTFLTAAQLRKCYMGARVKKTVREQLEELRSDVFEGETEASKLNRTRKRKSNAETQGINR